MRPHNIEVGDQVLLLQKTTKSKPRYDPDPYTVTKVLGSQITATRGEKIRVRDSKKFKKVSLRPAKNYQSQRQHVTAEEEAEFDLLNPIGTPAPTAAAATNTQAAAANTNQAAPNINNRYPNGYLIADPTLNRRGRQRQQPDRFVPR